MEQSALQRLFSELQAIEARRNAIQEELQASTNRVVRSQSSLGVELEALESFRGVSQARSAELDKAHAACVERIVQQRANVLKKERDVKLLEKLREDRLRVWHSGHAREVDQQAEESHLARWNRK
jgi:hypothetical protein